MPQMAPLWWESLYMLFTIMFIMTLIFIYHINFNSYNNKMIFFINKDQLNWKW